MQINLMVGSVIASFFDGVVSWMTYADRLYQLPLGVVGVAVGIVLMPDLSRRVKLGDEAGATRSLNRSAEFALALTLPATVALMLVPVEIARAIFERGAYTVRDAQQTGLAAALFAIGLPAFVLNKTLTPAFFAAEDSRTPLRLSLWAMGINTVLALAGAFTVGWVAIPVATAVAAWVNTVWLWMLLRKRGYAMDARLAHRLPRMVLASVAMGIVLWLCAQAAAGWFDSGLTRVPALLGLVAVGMVSYAVAARLMGAFTLAELKAGLRRT